MNFKNAILSIVFVVVANVYGNVIDIIDFDRVSGGGEVIGNSVSFKYAYEGETIILKIRPPEGVVVDKCYNMPWNATFADNTFSWTPDHQQSGSYSIAFSGNNPSSLITDPNSIPYGSILIIVYNSMFAIPINKQFQYMFSSVDPDEDLVELTVENLPEGATFEGGKYTPKLFTWTPSVSQAGVHEMVIKATDYNSSSYPLPVSQKISFMVSNEPNKVLGDLNSDGLVNLVDFGLFTSNWLEGVFNLNDYLLYASEMEGGRYFDGVDDYIEIPDSNSFDITNNLSICIWVKLGEERRNTYFQKVVIKPYVSVSDPWELFTIDLGNRSNTPRFIITDGNVSGLSAVAAKSSIIFNVNEWHHISGVYDGKKAYLYVDGNLESSVERSLQIGKNSMPIYIGAREKVNLFNGTLQKMKIYNYPLTGDDIKNIYNKEKSVVDPEVVVDPNTIIDPNSVFAPYLPKMSISIGSFDSQPNELISLEILSNIIYEMWLSKQE